MTRPARNAPSASDAPTASVPSAVSVPTRMIAMRNNSRLRVFRISARTRGTTVRAATSTPTTTSAALPKATTSPAALPAARPARNGSASIMGTTHRSWKIRTPVASRPWGVSMSPFSVSSFRTIAVLDSAARKPRNRATCHRVVPAAAAAAVAATVSPTWHAPATTTWRPISRSLLSENSIPIVKRSRITPTSARPSTRCTSGIKPSALGPSTTPATMNPGRAGRRRRWKTRTTTSEAPKMTARSRSTSSCSMAL